MTDIVVQGSGRIVGTEGTVEISGNLTVQEGLGEIADGSFKVGGSLTNNNNILDGSFEVGGVLTNNNAIYSGGFTKAVVNNSGEFSNAMLGDVAGSEGSAVRNSGINGEISGMGEFTGCSFGDDASVDAELSGHIDVAAQVNGTTVRLQYGEFVLDKLGAAPEGRVWARVTNAGNVPVAAADTVTLQTETYVSVPEWTLVGLDFDFDYFDEELIVSLPETLPDSVESIKGELAVVISNGGAAFTANNAFAEGDSFTVSLSALGEALGKTLPGENSGVEVSVQLRDEQLSGTAQSVTVPARPSYTHSGGLI